MSGIFQTQVPALSRMFLQKREGCFRAVVGPGVPRAAAPLPTPAPVERAPEPAQGAALGPGAPNAVSGTHSRPPDEGNGHREASRGGSLGYLRREVAPGRACHSITVLRAGTRAAALPLAGPGPCGAHTAALTPAGMEGPPGVTNCCPRNRTAPNSLVLLSHVRRSHRPSSRGPPGAQSDSASAGTVLSRNRPHPFSLGSRQRRRGPGQALQECLGRRSSAYPHLPAESAVAATRSTPGTWSEPGQKPCKRVLVRGSLEAGLVTSFKILFYNIIDFKQLTLKSEIQLPNPSDPILSLTNFRSFKTVFPLLPVNRKRQSH